MEVMAMNHGATSGGSSSSSQHPVTPRTQQICLDCGTVAESWSHERKCAKDVIWQCRSLKQSEFRRFFYVSHRSTALFLSQCGNDCWLQLYWSVCTAAAGVAVKCVEGLNPRLCVLFWKWTGTVALFLLFFQCHCTLLDLLHILCGSLAYSTVDVMSGYQTSNMAVCHYFPTGHTRYCSLKKKKHPISCHLGLWGLSSCWPTSSLWRQSELGQNWTRQKRKETWYHYFITLLKHVQISSHYPQRLLHHPHPHHNINKAWQHK